MDRGKHGAAARWAAIPRGSRLGLVLIAALTLPVVTFAGFSVVAVWRDTVTRRLAVEDSYRRIADVASARLDERVEAREREFLRFLRSAAESPSDLAGMASEAVEAHSWVLPLRLATAAGEFLAVPEPGGAPLLEGEGELLRIRLDKLLSRHREADGPAAPGAGRLQPEPQTPEVPSIHYLHGTGPGHAIFVSALFADGLWVGHRLDAEDVDPLLQGVLAEPGPWNEAAVVLIDPDGGVTGPSPADLTENLVPATQSLSTLRRWRLAAYPASAPLAALAAQATWRYAAIVVAAFIAVALAVTLAARSVAREVALARLRSRFVAGVTHELKTPLSMIRLLAENLRAGWIPAKQHESYYDLILSEADRLSRVVDNVLGLARLQVGRQRKYRLQAEDLRRLAEETVERYLPRLQEAAIELTVKMPERPVVARIDRDAITQVLVNLVSNAIKYIGEGERRVVVTVAQVEGRAAVSVQDTGIGLSDEEKARIFEPFFRADRAEVEAAGGSGLGLTISRDIAQAHGGSIGVEDVPGGGSRFTLYLPPAPEPTPVPVEAAAARAR